MTFVNNCLSCSKQDYKVLLFLFYQQKYLKVCHKKCSFKQNILSELNCLQNKSKIFIMNFKRTKLFVLLLENNFSDKYLR